MARFAHTTPYFAALALRALVLLAALACAPSAFAEGLRGDFNGDGFSDLAVGAPGATTGSATEAGMVHVIYGSAATGLRTDNDHYLFESMVGDVGRSEPGDHFGEVLAAGDFNGDGFSDLAIGHPSEDGDGPSGYPNDGAVSVVYGGPNGLGLRGTPLFGQLWDRYDFDLDFEDSSVGAFPQDAAHFGAALATGDFNGDGVDDLAVGAPDTKWKNLGALLDRRLHPTGAVFILFGSRERGLTVSGNQEFTPVQTSAWDDCCVDQGGDAEFGAALAAADFDGDGIDDLAVGAPGLTHRPILEPEIPEAGGVYFFFGSGQGFSQEDTLLREWPTDDRGPKAHNRLGAVLLAGDFDGDKIGDIAFGMPDGDVKDKAEAGVVIVIYDPFMRGAAHEEQEWTLDSIAGREAIDHDHFGAALAAADFDGDDRMDLAIGVPDREVNGVPNAGAVSILYGTQEGFGDHGNELRTQGDEPLVDPEGLAEADDRFGASVTAANFGRGAEADLAVGIPCQDVHTGGPNGPNEDAGGVIVMYDIGHRRQIGEPPIVERPPVHGPLHQIGGIQSLYQGTNGLAGVARAGNRFGHLCQ